MFTSKLPSGRKSKILPPHLGDTYPWPKMSARIQGYLYSILHNLQKGHERKIGSILPSDVTPALYNFYFPDIIWRKENHIVISYEPWRLRWMHRHLCRHLGFQSTITIFIFNKLFSVLYPSYLSMEEIVENKKIMYLLHTG